MKLARYALEGEAHYGILAGDDLADRLAGSPFGDGVPTGQMDDLAAARILNPVGSPRIFGLGYNYLAHIEETGRPVPEQPVLFMKPSTSAIGPDEPVLYPPRGENVHFEGELVVVIGKQARHVSEQEALDYVLGYTCGNDVSDRVLQRRESAFGCLLAGKGYDSFAPLGPVIATDIDPMDVRIRTRVNGVERQNSSTSRMHYSVPYIISYLSRYITLLPGDLIMTGTPEGVGPIKIGDVIEVEIDGIGILRNPVVADAGPWQS